MTVAQMVTKFQALYGTQKFITSVCWAVWQQLTDVSEYLSASIIRLYLLSQTTPLRLRAPTDKGTMTNSRTLLALYSVESD
jgi:hypothetical protein